MTAEGQRNGPIQDAIREWDAQLGHAPKAPSEGRAVSVVTFFHPPTYPNGGTVYVRPDVPEETQ